MFEEIFMAIVTVGLFIGLFLLIRNKWAEDAEMEEERLDREAAEAFVPPMISQPEEVNTILIGKYYGDPESKRCVVTISFENGIIAFRYTNPRSSVNSLPVEVFVKKFTKLPNGCEFDAD